MMVVDAVWGSSRRAWNSGIPVRIGSAEGSSVETAVETSVDHIAIGIVLFETATCYQEMATFLEMRPENLDGQVSGTWERGGRHRVSGDCLRRTA